MSAHRKGRLDPIGDIPKHRSGGAPLKHRALEQLGKPAALFDEANNVPMTRRAVARRGTVQAAGAVGKVGGLLILRKAASGHDAFELS